jgi:hypothetical protein
VYFVATQGQIYQKLEEYLKQQDWKNADYETAFIMYQWMVIENYKDFYKFYRMVSLEVIDEIDRLWVKYSEGKFGIRGQAKIYRDLKGKKKYNEEVWERFGARVGWREDGWLDLEEVAYHATTQPRNHFPILMYNRVSGCSRFGLWGLCGAEREFSSNMPGGVDVVFPRIKT